MSAEAYVIRLARDDDADLLPEVERAAGRRFADVGMAHVADGEPVGADDHRAALALGQLWVAADAGDRPVGFALAHRHDGCAYLEEISVHPDHGGRQLGTRLLDAVVAWARAERLPAVLLSTFRDVPWNAPWYRRHGFRDLAETELTPFLLDVRGEESANGLDPAERVFMRLECRR